MIFAQQSHGVSAVFRRYWGGGRTGIAGQTGVNQ